MRLGRRKPWWPYYYKKRKQESNALKTALTNNQPKLIHSMSTAVFDIAEKITVIHFLPEMISYLNAREDNLQTQPSKKIALTSRWRLHKWPSN